MQIHCLESFIVHLLFHNWLLGFTNIKMIGQLSRLICQITRLKHSIGIVSNLHESAVELRRVLTFLLTDHDLNPEF